MDVYCLDYHVKIEAIVLSGCSDHPVTCKSQNYGLKCCHGMRNGFSLLPYWHYGRVSSSDTKTSVNGTKFVPIMTYLVWTESSNCPLHAHLNFAFVSVLVAKLRPTTFWESHGIICLFWMCALFLDITIGSWVRMWITYNDGDVVGLPEMCSFTCLSCGKAMKTSMKWAKMQPKSSITNAIQHISIGKVLLNFTAIIN